MKEDAPQVDVGSGSGSDTMEALRHGEAHLKPRLSKLTMVGMSFAILKYVSYTTHCCPHSQKLRRISSGEPS